MLKFLFYFYVVSYYYVRCLLRNNRLNIRTTSSNTILYGSKPNIRKAYADDLVIEDNQCRNAVDVQESSANTKCCYFNKYTPCPLNKICPYDERPCKANRTYFDEIFANNDNINEGTNNQQNNNNSEEEEELSNDNIMQMTTTSKYLTYKRYLSRKEMRARRQKLFLMSTWLEDLLPDPHQGKDLVLNWTVDMFKIVYRSVLIVLSMTTIINKPKFLDFYDNIY